jgi:hypothetical protein
MEPMNGYSFSSETQVASQVADDFLCKDGLPIIKVTWWGSYWDSLYNGTNYYPQPNSGAWGDPIPNPPGTVSSFIINFYQDVPAQTGVPPWSHPGAQLYAETMDLDGVQVTETFFGTINRQGSIETVYEYTATLPVGRPFKQEAGNIYWLSIQAVDSDGDPIQWGWHESKDHWNDNAVQMGYSPQGWWDLLPGEDMAFELQAVPIPSTLLLLGSGLAFLFRLRRRR